MMACAPTILAQEPVDLLRRAQYLRMQDIDSSSWYAHQAYEKAMKAGSDSVVHAALFLKAWNLQTKGQCEDANELYHTLISDKNLPEANPHFIRATGRIGVCLTDLAKYDSALVYLLKYDALVDRFWGQNSIEAKLQLGELYRAMGRMQQSNTYKLEAIRRARTGGHRIDLITSLYYYLDDNLRLQGADSLDKYLDEYLDLTGQIRMDGTTDYSHAGMLLADIPASERIRILRTAINRQSARGRSKGFLFLNKQLVVQLAENGQIQSAIPMAHEGLETAITHGDYGYILEYNGQLSDLYAKSGQPDLALQHIHTYYNLKDSLQEVSISKNLDALNVQYETAKKEAQITDQELEIQRKTNQRNLLIGGLAMALWFGTFIALYLWNRNRLTRRLAEQEAEMNKQHIAKLQQEKQLLAMHSMIEGQEAERMRIARDLHDGLGGLLSTVKAHFSVIQKELEKLQSIDVYGEVDHLIDTASAEVRRISHNMAPHALRFGGLKDALADLASQMRGHGLNVTFEWPDHPVKLEQSAEIMIYRIVQELTNNVVKYAQAGTLLIQVHQLDNELSLVVEDDGVGFNVDQASSTGLGLKSIASRVSYLNGSLDIDSMPKVGTTVTVQIPVKGSVS